MEKQYLYTHKSIIDGKEIRYNPFKVKDQLKLIQIHEDIEAETITSMTFLDLLRNMCSELISVPESDLYYNDFEYLVYLIRSKSYGSIIKYTKEEKNNPEPGVVNLEFNISEDIKISGSEKFKDHIKLENGKSIKIRPLTVKEHFSIPNDISDDRKEYKELELCLDSIVTENEVLKIEDKKEFFEDLYFSDLKKVVKQFNKIPRVELFKKTKIDGETYITNFGDTNNSFFVLS